MKNKYNIIQRVPQWISLIRYIGIPLIQMSTYITPKPGPAQKGRPKNSGVLKPPERKATEPAKLSPELLDIVRSERRFNESYSDTILRLLLEKSKKYVAARKKADALEERLQSVLLMKSQYIIREGP